MLSLHTFSNQFTFIIMKKLVLAIVLMLSAGVSSAYVQQMFGLIDLEEITGDGSHDHFLSE